MTPKRTVWQLLFQLPVVAVNVLTMFIMILFIRSLIILLRQSAILKTFHRLLLLAFDFLVRAQYLLCASRARRAPPGDAEAFLPSWVHHFWASNVPEFVLNSLVFFLADYSPFKYRVHKAT